MDLPLCPYDDSFGIYDRACPRCMARAYARATEREQLVIRAHWRATLKQDEYDDMRRLVQEERARDEQRRARSAVSGVRDADRREAG